MIEKSSTGSLAFDYAISEVTRKLGIQSPATPTKILEDREQLELIVRCDPSLLLRHLEEDTAYNAKLIGRMLELAKERAKEILIEDLKE